MFNICSAYYVLQIYKNITSPLDATDLLPIYLCLLSVFMPLAVHGSSTALAGLTPLYMSIAMVEMMTNVNNDRINTSIYRR